MFTGIIEETGKVTKILNKNQALTLTISAKKVLEGLKVGDSISVNGICLTVEGFNASSFSATAVSETIKTTTLGKLKVGAVVNLERALKMGDRLGGHMVSGHVDAIGKIIEKRRVGESTEIKFRFPSDFSKLVVAKGSIAVDGISLTVAQTRGNEVKVAVIPQTLKETILNDKHIGEEVNLEFDSMAKYAQKNTASGGGSYNGEF
jgi:riboflavin synthase